MRLRILWFLALVLAVGAFAAAPITVEEVIKLCQNGVSDGVIVAVIDQTNAYFSLSTDDLIKLKQAGASDYLVNYMVARKPGGPAPATTGGGVNVAGRTTGGSETSAPAKKFGDLTVNLKGKYTVSSNADLNVFYGAYVDGERKYVWDQWTSIVSITSPETGERRTKRTLAPQPFTIKVPVGVHNLSLVMWSGTSTLDDNAAKSYVVYTKQVEVKEGAPTVLDLVGDTDAAGRFVVR